jgi:uracil-DNA glycosylase
VSEPFAYTSGPVNAKIVIVGEAFGETEDLLKKPFAGYSGKELFLMLTEVFSDIAPKEAAFVRSCMGSDSLWIKQREGWLQEASILFTNTLAIRPPNNDLDQFCVKKAEVGDNYPYPPLKQGKYLRWEYLAEVDRLRAELQAVQPNLIIPMGNTACWAVLRTTAIGSIRGTVTESPYGKALPTYHPAAVLRQWSHRPIVIADLMKARREADFPDVRRPEREVLVNPTDTDVAQWYEHAKGAAMLAVDIETARGQITMIGFASSPKYALVVPFVNPDGSSYWRTAEEERWAWDMVEKLLQLPCPKIFQNGLYDLQYILKMGLRPTNCLHDSMLLHHSIYPEMQKGLGFLGSIYTNESSWKLLRHKAEEIKKDE